MTIEVHQHKIVLALELPYQPAERIYLAWSTCNEIFLLAVYRLESLLRITLYILASYGWYQLLHRGRYIMLRSLPIYIIATSHYLIALLYELSADFKSDATTGALLSDILVITPRSPGVDFRILQSSILMAVSTDIQAQSTFRAFRLVNNGRLVEPILVESYLDYLSRTGRRANSTAIAIFYRRNMDHLQKCVDYA